MEKVDKVIEFLINISEGKGFISSIELPNIFNCIPRLDYFEYLYIIERVLEYFKGNLCRCINALQLFTRFQRFTKQEWIDFIQGDLGEPFRRKEFFGYSLFNEGMKDRVMDDLSKFDYYIFLCESFRNNAGGYYLLRTRDEAKKLVGNVDYYESPYYITVPQLLKLGIFYINRNFNTSQVYTEKEINCLDLMKSKFLWRKIN